MCFTVRGSFIDPTGPHRTRTDNFKHLARLEGLIPAYVATVVEVVRRREFCELLSARSSSSALITFNSARLLAHYSLSLSTSLGPLSSRERDLRSAYRSTFSGKLPWEVRGLSASTDEAIPSLELDVKNSGDDLPELGRESLLGLQQSFAEMEDSLERSNEGRKLQPNNPIKKARRMLDELLASLDELEVQFEKIALGVHVSRFTLRST